MKEYIRTQLLLGAPVMKQLWRKHVIVFGVGGVGGYVTEALARSGIGHLTLVDNDEVSESNINRQIIALHSTIGRQKTEVMRERILDINPKIRVEVRNCFFLPENADTFSFADYDYVVDAVDTVTAKIAIIQAAKAADVPVISSMGAGNKLDPFQFQIADIAKTSVCPLAKVMRRELKNRGIKKVKVLYSTELAQTPKVVEGEEKGGRPAPGSIAFVPSVAGLMIAGEVIKEMAKRKHYQYLLFDLDGTIANSEEGITKSAQYALKEQGIEETDLTKLRRFIGPPLTDSFMEYYGMSREEALEATAAYRVRYSQGGMFECSIYEGMEALLKKLREAGYYVAVATSKPLAFTEPILKKFGLYELFDFVAGPDLDEHLSTKAMVIEHVMAQHPDSDKSQYLMIGDRMHDMVGAKENQIDSVGAVYGFGTEEELKKYGATYLVDSVEELEEFLLG